MPTPARKALRPLPLSSAGYAAEGGSRCPFCGSTDLTGHSIDVEAGGASQRVDCNVCDRSWFDCYTLTGYEPL